MLRRALLSRQLLSPHRRCASTAPAISRYDTDSHVEYSEMSRKVDLVRQRMGRPLTYTEKILFGHLVDAHIDRKALSPGSYVSLRPSRVACPDSTGQMALLQLLTTGIDNVRTPTTVHCDHLIIAKEGARHDVEAAVSTNGEVYNFLASACARFGIGFYGPNSGIIHQILLEQYAYPGGLLIGSDSHTPNAGGLGMLAIGVGGADAVDAMIGLPWEVAVPRVLGIRLTGKLNGWAAPKDIILHIVGELTVKGGTGRVLEFFGPGVESLSATGMATICNMGAETGATTSVFPYTQATDQYLRATERADIASHAAEWQHLLRADDNAEYERIVDVDLSAIEPIISGPFTPDMRTPISQFKAKAIEHGWPTSIEVGLIGSCTNSSYHDLGRAASIAREAVDNGLKSKSRLLISPGSEMIRATVDRDGILDIFDSAGGEVLASACGPCIGSWDRNDVPKHQRNSIISSYNRNFTGRNDGNPATHSFLASPEIVMALSIAGDLTFNPLTDDMLLENGDKLRFATPDSKVLPMNGFEAGMPNFQAPKAGIAGVDVLVRPDSDRLQLLEAFPPWDGQDFTNCPVLIKVSGRCTTDAISAAGPWLKYRGHLGNIANNTLSGATNADNGLVNSVVSCLTGKSGTVADVAHEYKAAGIKSVVIGDDNYGEGSSREHAALQPRHLGVVAVIAKSIARIHETNLKKQGSDSLDLIGLRDFNVGRTIIMRVRAADGGTWTAELKHTYSDEQLSFFRAGSALNYIRQN